MALDSRLPHTIARYRRPWLHRHTVRLEAQLLLTRLNGRPCACPGGRGYGVVVAVCGCGVWRGKRSGGILCGRRASAPHNLRCTRRRRCFRAVIHGAMRPSAVAWVKNGDLIGITLQLVQELSSRNGAENTTY